MSKLSSIAAIIEDLRKFFSLKLGYSDMTSFSGNS